MAVNYQQTDSAAPSGAIVACSGGTLATTVNPRLASAGGTAGTTPVTAGGANWDNGTERVIYAIEIEPAGGTTWDAGTWTVRFEVSTGQASTTLSAIYICRLNAAGVNQATIGSVTGLSAALTTGVKEQAVTGAAQTPAGGDSVYIVIIGAATLNNRSIEITPSQIIASPFTAPAGGTKKRTTAALLARRGFSMVP